MEVAKPKLDSSKDDLNMMEGTENRRSERKSRVRAPSSLLDRLAATPGFVDKPSVEVEDSLARRRTPRMASLNAAAKVNLFFEPSSPLAGRSLTEIHHHSTRKTPRTNSDGSMRNGSLDSENYFNYDDLVPEEIESLSDKQDLDEEVALPTRGRPRKEDKDLLYTNGGQDSRAGRKRKSEADSTTEGVIRKARKNFNIDTLLRRKEQEMELDLECDTTTGEFPKSMVDACIQVDLPRPTPQYKHIRLLSVPIKGQLVTPSGSMAFTKNHVVAPGGAVRPPVEMTISKTAVTKRTASLNAQAMLNAMMSGTGPLVKLKGVGNLIAERSKLKRGGKDYITKQEADSSITMPIRVPKIYFAATSTSTFSAGRSRPTGNPVKSVHMKNLSLQLEKLQAERTRQETWMPKRTNGWTYHGTPLDKPYCYDDQVVIRHYYSGIQRGDEIINVRDSVLLKAGTRRRDQPYVARVSGLWEENEGPNAGEMMMSVFWYYRPEQTEVGRMSNIHGEMELLASRHKDDNSVACIVDKCYALSYPEYCRYRAQNKLYQESRATPLSPVPPGQSTRPGSIPSPDTDPSLVFFCRQVYDYRMGRIIKNPV